MNECGPMRAIRQRRWRRRCHGISIAEAKSTGTLAKEGRRDDAVEERGHRWVSTNKSREHGSRVKTTSSMAEKAWAFGSDDVDNDVESDDVD